MLRWVGNIFSPSKQPPGSPQRSALERDVSLKILVVGAPAVGKTTIVWRYTHGCWTNYYRPTVGIELQSVRRDIDGQQIVMNFWDIPYPEVKGQNAPWIFSKASGIVMVVSCEAKNTERSVLAIQEWGDKLERFYRRRVPTVLLLHKHDLGNPFPSASDLDSYCAKNGFRNWFFSTVNNPKTINTAIDRLVALILADKRERAKKPKQQATRVLTKPLPTTPEDYQRKFTKITELHRSFFSSLRKNLDFLAAHCTDEVVPTIKGLLDQCTAEQSDLEKSISDVDPHSHPQHSTQALETPAYTLAELSHKWQSTICALMDGVAQYTLAEPYCFERLKYWPQPSPSLVVQPAPVTPITHKKPAKWFRNQQTVTGNFQSYTGEADLGSPIAVTSSSSTSVSSSQSSSPLGTPSSTPSPPLSIERVPSPL